MDAGRDGSWGGGMGGMLPKREGLKSSKSFWRADMYSILTAGHCQLSSLLVRELKRRADW